MSLPATELRETVGPYRLVRAIGAGGSARIDLARIERAYNFQRHVVIKRPLEHLRASHQVAASLRREARIGGRLRHPNLVAVLDAGEHDGYDYLVLEYVHGASLRTLMQTENAALVRAMPIEVALAIAIDVARGLHDAHELTDEQGSPLGLVHRDVSPGNVLVDLDGSVKLADFGIAKETRVATLSGSMHGTVTYMAPEQCRGHAFDRRADIFSIGVILYELLTHARLFWADNDVASLHRVLSGEIARPRTLMPQLSPALEEVVMTAVAHDPTDRFASARDLADALEGLAAIEGHVIGARWIARTVEEVVGPRRAPWIAATPAPAPLRRGEGSLIAVIESLAPEEEKTPVPLATFGPADRRDAEEGSLPLPPKLRQAPQPASTTTLTPAKRGRVYAAIAAGLIAGVAIVIGVAKTGTDAEKPSPTPSPTPTPTPSPTPTVTPTPLATPAPTPAVTRDPEPPHVAPESAPPVAAIPGSKRVPPAKGNRGRHNGAPPHPVAAQPPAVAAQPAPASPPAPSAPAAATTATQPPPPTKVEWNSEILLPTDHTGSARPK